MPKVSGRRRPARVAHLIQNLNYGGMERVLHSLANQLPAAGFEVHVVVLQYLGRFAEGLEDRVTCHQVPPMSRLSLIHPAPLRDLLRRLQPDIVHSHTGVWFKASRAAHLAGVPAMVHTEHGRPDPVPCADRLIDNLASRRTRIVIAVSEALADVLRRQVVHDPSRVRVIANGVDLARLQGADTQVRLRGELDLPLDRPVIGSIGRLEPVKNYALSLRALARLRPGGGSPPVLVLIGDGSERASLEALATELGVADRVRFLGWRTDADRLYQAFDLFTLPSLSEGTSISLLEAMGSGVCPVVTDVGGNRSVLGPELARLLVRCGDATALAEAWSRLLSDPAERAALGRIAARRVAESFSLDRMVAQHIALYNELLGPASVGADTR